MRVNRPRKLIPRLSSSPEGSFLHYLPGYRAGMGREGRGVCAQSTDTQVRDYFRRGEEKPMQDNLLLSCTRQRSAICQPSEFGSWSVDRVMIMHGQAWGGIAAASLLWQVSASAKISCAR